MIKTKALFPLVLIRYAALVPLGALIGGCATPVPTPGGEVVCYSSNCVRQMQAWTRDEYLRNQYEEEERRRAAATPPPPPPPVKPAPPPPKARTSPGPLPCPPGMVPVTYPEAGCVYPRR